MNIRLAEAKDIPFLEKIYTKAKLYMQQNGNPTQWPEGYPSLDILMEDCKKKHLYVITDSENTIHAAFVLAMGEDPTYAYIENGTWPNDAPYGTIHRIASDLTLKGVGELCINYCKTMISNLRCDTHADNNLMNNLLIKNGFKKCGIIYVADGTKRIAYQWTSLSQ